MSWSIVFLIVAVVAAFGGIMWWGRLVLKDHPIRAVAVICVAIIGGYVMWMGFIHTEILRDPNWCNKAIQAERITPGTSFQGLTACIDLLKIQINAEATNSHIYAGSAAATLLALIVIVIAQGKAQVQAPGGFGGSFGPSGEALETPASKAATQTAGAAVEEAKKIVEEEQPAKGAQLAPGEDG